MIIFSGETLSGEIFVGRNYSSGEIFVTCQKIRHFRPTKFRPIRYDKIMRLRTRTRVLLQERQKSQCEKKRYQHASNSGKGTFLIFKNVTLFISAVIDEMIKSMLCTTHGKHPRTYLHQTCTRELNVDPNKTAKQLATIFSTVSFFPSKPLRLTPLSGHSC